MTTSSQPAQRFSELPQRENFPEGERSDLDVMVDHWINGARARNPQTGTSIPLEVLHYQALAVTPRFGVATMQAALAALEQRGKPGSYSGADWEMIDQVVAFDSGYLGLLEWHTPAAIREGIRLGALEALAEGREDKLTADEHQQVEFIRAVRDGLMTDDIWTRMVERLSSERGVVDYVGAVLTVLFHHRFSWAVGAPAMRRGAWRQMINDFKARSAN